MDNYFGLMSCDITHLKLIDGDPSVCWKVLKHWNEELEASIPVTNQKHHTDKVEYSHEHSGDAEELEK